MKSMLPVKFPWATASPETGSSRSQSSTGSGIDVSTDAAEVCLLSWANPGQSMSSIASADGMAVIASIMMMTVQRIPSPQPLLTFAS